MIRIELAGVGAALSVKVTGITDFAYLKKQVSGTHPNINRTIISPDHFVTLEVMYSATLELRVDSSDMVLFLPTAPEQLGVWYKVGHWPQSFHGKEAWVAHAIKEWFSTYAPSIPVVVSSDTDPKLFATPKGEGTPWV